MTYASAYILVLILFVFIGILINPKNKFAFFIFLDFIISIPSYFTRTPAGMYYDQDRFNTLLDTIRNINQTGLLNGLNWSLQQSDYSNEPGSAVYVWFFSLFKNNGFLRFGTTLIFLGLLSFFIIKAGKKLNVSNKDVIGIQLLILLSFNIFYEISGIRNFLAFMIIAVSLYCDFSEKDVKKKWPFFIFYFVAYAIHNSILPFIIFRIILLLHNRIINIIAIFSVLMYNIYLSALLQWLSGISVLSSFTTKANFYLTMQQQDINFSGKTDIVIMSIILMALIFERLIYMYICRQQVPKQYMKYYDLVMFYIIGSMSITQVYIRTIFFLLFLSVPVKVQLFSNLDIKNKISFVMIYRVSIYIISILIFILWMAVYYVNVLI